MTNGTPSGPDPEPAVERTLKEALAVSPASKQRLERLRAAVDREWRGVAHAKRAIFLGRITRFALAGAAAAAVWAVFWFGGTASRADSFGSMSRLDAGGLSVRSGFFGHRHLENGDALRVGDRLTTRGAALISLAQGGTLRLAPGSTLTIDSASQLSLQRGLIYVDIPPERTAVEHLRVATRAGSVEHVGTEFEVMSDDRTVRVRVREGRVRFLGKSDTVIANAGIELLAAPDQTISRRSIDTYGGEWLWTSMLAPDYVIEGKPLIGFLNWVSRELGRPLDFADDNARRVADRTILHGSVRGQPPLKAMSNVLSTAALTYEIRGDTIWVRSYP